MSDLRPVDREDLENLKQVLLQTQLLVDLTSCNTRVADGILNEDEQWNAALMSIEHPVLDLVRTAADPSGTVCFVTHTAFEAVHAAMLRADLLAQLTSSTRYIERRDRDAAESWNAYLLHLAAGLRSFVANTEALAAQ